LAPSDFHPFEALMKAVRSCQFTDDDVDVIKAVHEWLCNQPKTLFFQRH
jgi:hypothetical protein